jgi:hypothetical protein
MTSPNPGALKLLADLLLADLLEALALTPGGPPDMSYVAIGNVALDVGPYAPGSGPCQGQAFVTFTRVFPTLHFPTPAVTLERCLRWGISYSLGVTRCVPTPDETWTLDDIAAAGDAASVIAYADTAAVAIALDAFIASPTVDYMALAGDVTPYGPAGGVVGVVGSVVVDLTLAGFC